MLFLKVGEVIVLLEGFVLLVFWDCIGWFVFRYLIVYFKGYFRLDFFEWRLEKIALELFGELVENSYFRVVF